MNRLVQIWCLLALVSNAAVAQLVSVTSASQDTKTLGNGTVKPTDLIRQVKFRGPPVFSPDGQFAGVVAWHGDLARNVNVYRLFVFNVAQAIRDRRLAPATYEISVANDSSLGYQNAAPFGELQIGTDQRTGRAFATFLHGMPRQVYRFDIGTRELRALTHEPTSITRYCLAPGGYVALFAAEVEDSTDKSAFQRVARIRDAGLTSTDTSVYTEFAPREFGWSVANALEMITRPRLPKRWRVFSLASRDASSRQLYRTGRYELRSSYDDFPGRIPLKLSCSPTGGHGIVWPWAASDTSNLLRADQYGLVNLAGGRLTPLSVRGRAPSTMQAVWSPTGESVVVSGAPDSASEAAARREGRQPDYRWTEVDITTGRGTPVNLPGGWKPLRWDADANALIVQEARYNHVRLGSVRRTATGWSALEPLWSAKDSIPDGIHRADFSAPRFGAQAWDVRSTGRLLLGVVENRLFPPELAAMDLTTRQLIVLSDFNAVLRGKQLGQVSTFTYLSPNDRSEGFGCLVLPPNAVRGQRLPVVFLIERVNCDDPAFPPFKDFGPDLNSSIPVHALAAQGIAVFSLRDPRQTFDIRKVLPTGQWEEKETFSLKLEFERAVRALADSGIIDSLRVGITGFSRGGWWTDALLTQSHVQIAAASKTDGGTQHYEESRPFTTSELMHIRAPLLNEWHDAHPLTAAFQVYQLWSLSKLGKQVEYLWIPSAPHHVVTPQHRWRSLNMHTDWFRFWLQGYEDPDPAKRAQYERWRKLRSERQREGK